MTIRPFSLPADTATLIDLLPRTFQYPENPQWNLQADEVESMLDTMRAVRRMWPILRFIQLISPPFRDVLRGFIWEEDGQAVGVVNITRQGMSDCWYIGNVGVIPTYRRRGIARKLVEAAIQFARDQHGKSVTLDVIDGNIPAYQLYERLGFEHFAGSTEYEYTQSESPPEYPLPEGYLVAPLDRFDWRSRYELAQRITPENVQKYQPVEEARFRQPAALRWFAPTFERLTGTRADSCAVRTQSGEIVAIAGYSARYRSGGVNNINLRLSSDHIVVASYLIRHLTRVTQNYSPGRRIEFAATTWQPELNQAALDAGFTKRYRLHTMGLLL